MQKAHPGWEGVRGWASWRRQHFSCLPIDLVDFAIQNCTLCLSAFPQ